VWRCVNSLCDPGTTATTQGANKHNLHRCTTGEKNVCKAMKAAIERRFESKVFQTALSSSAKIQEAEANKRTIFQHDRQSNGARDFMELGREVLDGVRP